MDLPGMEGLCDTSGKPLFNFGAQSGPIHADRVLIIVQLPTSRLGVTGPSTRLQLGSSGCAHCRFWIVIQRPCRFLLLHESLLYVHLCTMAYQKLKESDDAGDTSHLLDTFNANEIAEARQSGKSKSLIKTVAFVLIVLLSASNIATMIYVIGLKGNQGTATCSKSQASRF